MAAERSFSCQMGFLPPWVLDGFKWLKTRCVVFWNISEFSDRNVCINWFRERVSCLRDRRRRLEFLLAGFPRLRSWDASDVGAVRLYLDAFVCFGNWVLGLCFGVIAVADFMMELLILDCFFLFFFFETIYTFWCYLRVIFLISYRGFLFLVSFLPHSSSFSCSSILLHSLILPYLLSPRPHPCKFCVRLPQVNPNSPKSIQIPATTLSNFVAISGALSSRRKLSEWMVRLYASVLYWFCDDIMCHSRFYS